MSNKKEYWAVMGSEIYSTDPHDTSYEYKLLPIEKGIIIHVWALKQSYWVTCKVLNIGLVPVGATNIWDRDIFGPIIYWYYGASQKSNGKHDILTLQKRDIRGVLREEKNNPILETRTISGKVRFKKYDKNIKS